MNESHEFLDGTALAGTPYRILKELGSGGMGTVYEVEHVRLQMKMVLKALHEHHKPRLDLVERLQREFLSLAKLRHPRIVQVSDAGFTKEGTPYFVMEKLRGETLSQRMRRGPIPWREAVSYAVAILEGLDYAHLKGVIHRDIKPANLFIDDSHGLKILDFGIAKLTIEPGLKLTAEGAAVGTPRYMSPEQAAGRSVDCSSDLYSLGCLFFEMLTGRSPFNARSASGYLLAKLSTPPPKLSSLVPELPDFLGIAIEQLLDLLPERRPKSAGSLAQELRTLLLPTGQSSGDLGATQSVSVAPLATASAQFAWVGAGETAPLATSLSTTVEPVGANHAPNINAVGLEEETQTFCASLKDFASAKPQRGVGNPARRDNSPNLDKNRRKEPALSLSYVTRPPVNLQNDAGYLENAPLQRLGEPLTRNLADTIYPGQALFASNGRVGSPVERKLLSFSESSVLLRIPKYPTMKKAVASKVQRHDLLITAAIGAVIGGIFSLSFFVVFVR